MPYDPVNGKNDPVRYGFKAGKYYKDGSTQYVGFGGFKGYCEIQSQVPAAIQLTPKPGAYMSCLNRPYVDKKTAHYLLKHPDLQWVKTNNKDMHSLQNALKVNPAPTEHFLFGRIKIDGEYRLGKVEARGGINEWDGLWVEGQTAESHHKRGFEVLVCDEAE